MTIEEIVANDIKIEKIKIVYKKREINELNPYNISVFCCSFENKEMLKEHYKSVVNSVAVNMQAKMTKKIEMYNIYILFFTKDIDYNLAFEIEKDMYSSRKIVIFDELSDDPVKIDEVIDEKLFYIHDGNRSNVTEFELEIFKDNKNKDLKNYIDKLELDLDKKKEEIEIKIDELINIFTE